MPSVRDIRRRIRSVQNTGKVTNAMSLVAASKMRRAQMATVAGRPYSEKIREVIADLAAQPSEDVTQVHPLLQVRPVQRIGVVAITPDRGLAGGLHSTINRRVAQFILAQEAPVRTVVVGRKGRDFMVRSGQDVQAVFTDLGDRPVLTDTTPISSMVIESYEQGEVDEVYLVYARFVSTMSQQAVVEKLLPVDPDPFGPVATVRLHLRARYADGAGNAAAPVRGHGGLSRHAGSGGQRAVGPDGGHAQRHRQCQLIGRGTDPGDEQAAAGQHYQ